MLKRSKSAAALSAAVDSHKPIGDRTHSQAEPTPKDRPTLNASRSSGEGVWGRGASLREAASPPESSHNYLFEREREGGGFSSEKPPPSHTPLLPKVVSHDVKWEGKMAKGVF